MASEDSAQVEGERQRRIRAALHACQSISTEALEAGVVPEMVAVIEDIAKLQALNVTAPHLNKQAQAALAKLKGQE